MITCGEALVKMLGAYGIDLVSGIPGTHTIALYKGLMDAGIRHVSPRHEQGAGFLADGYARVTGKPAACFTVSGPGAFNIATAMGQALQDSIPMLVISADNERSLRGFGGGRLHETADLGIAMAQVSRWQHVVMSAAELPQVLARTFSIFHSERPGPVHLTLPMDVMISDASNVDIQPWALPARPAADPRAIEQSADLLNSSVRPVIALGGGAIGAADKVVVLAEMLDAPVTLTHNAKGLLASDHPLLVKSSPSYEPVRELYQQADVVVGIGTEFSETDYDFFFNGGFGLGGDLIRIDIDIAQLSRNAQAEIGIHADASLALQALLPLLEKHPRDGAARTAGTNEALLQLDNPSYQAFLDCLQTTLPEVVLMVDSTQPGYFAGAQYHASGPRRFASAATGYGTLGFALPAAMGAKLARPELPVVALIGDGGLQFTLNELAAAVEAKLAIAIVVWHNERYEMIAQNFENAELDPIGCDITSPDFLAAANAFGCVGLRASNLIELTEALKIIGEKDVPTVIEVREEDFLK